ncbi:MAG: ComEC/Rec2 family competence protein [Candidatus Krumholzibacteriia bacterium]
MLSVDPTRRRRVAADRFRSLISVCTGPSWPAVWAGVALVGALGGARHPLTLAHGTAEIVVRTATLLSVPFLAARSAPVRAAAIAFRVGLSLLVGAVLAGSPPLRAPAAAPQPWSPSAAVQAPGNLVGRVTADARERSGGSWSAPLSCLAWRPAAAATGLLPGPGVLLRGQGPAPERGALIAAQVTLRPPRRAALPGGFDEAAWLRGRDLAAVAQVEAWAATPSRDRLATLGGHLAAVRRHLAARLDRGLPPLEADLARAVLLGDGLDADLRGPFTSLGLAHLFALSGLHVGILAGLAFVVLRLVPAPGTLRDLSLLPLLILYALLVDLPGSVVRACGLVVCAVVVRVGGRRHDTLRTLGLVLWCNVLWRPWVLVDAGCQLSYLAAGGIVAGQRLVTPLAAGLPRVWRRVVAPVTVTVAAQIATLPVVARAFGALPLFGPLVNLLVVPAFGIVVTVLAAGLGLACVWPWAGDGLLACGALGLRLVTVTCLTAASGGLGRQRGLAPWADLHLLGYLGLVAVIGAGLRRRTRRGLGLAAVAYVGLVAAAVRQPPPGGPVAAWQLAVGQGDCALIEFADRWRVLVDTGERWRTGGGPLVRDVLPWLRRRGVTRLDAVVLTHGHADHTGGAADLAAAVAVDRWLVGGRARPPAGRTGEAPAVGDTLHACGGWALVVLHPASGDRELADENDRSLALGLVHDGTLTGLWSGDLEHRGEERLLGRCPPVADAGLAVWKAGHHGSATSGTPALLAALRPQLVVISAGVDNRYGHPSHGPYLAAGDTVPILRTDLDGTIALVWTARGLRARSLRSP